MTPDHPLRLARRWALFVVLLSVIGAASAYGVVRAVTPVYSTSGSVLVGASTQTTYTLSVDQLTANTAALMVQPPTIERVASDLGGIRSAAELAQEVRAIPRPSTLVIDVTANDTDPSVAARIVNRLAQDYAAQVAADNAAQLQRSTQVIGDQIKTIAADITELQSQLAAAQKAKQDISILQQQLTQDDQLLAQLDSSQAQLQIEQAGAQQTIRVIATASVPMSPISPNKRNDILLGAACGLLIAIALAALYEFLDQGVRTEEDVRARLGVPCLGVVPRFSAAPRATPAKEGGRQVGDRDVEAAAEAYRRLRTSIRFATLGTEVRSLVVTSARMGEGKSQTAANLAGITAAAGESVLLVDCDLRRPTQHRFFGKLLTGGLSDMLLAAAREGTIPSLNGQHVTSLANLTVVPSGTIPPNPSELLASRHTVALLDQWRRAFDLVIIDTPPTDVVSDALTMAHDASAVILVVDPARTDARRARAAIGALRESGTEVLGVVLNKVRRRRWAASPYYYAYDYTTKQLDGEGPRGGRDARESPLDTAWRPLSASPRR